MAAAIDHNSLKCKRKIQKLGMNLFKAHYHHVLFSAQNLCCKKNIQIRYFGQRIQRNFMERDLYFTLVIF